MKPTEKALLTATAIGVAAGVGLSFLIEGANIWFYVGTGVVVAAIANDRIRKQMLEDRQINGDDAAKNRG